MCTCTILYLAILWSWQTAMAILVVIEWDHVYFSPLKPTVGRQSTERSTDSRPTAERRRVGRPSPVGFCQNPLVPSQEWKIAFMAKVIKPDFSPDSGLSWVQNRVSPTLSRLSRRIRSHFSTGTVGHPSHRPSFNSRLTVGDKTAINGRPTVDWCRPTVGRQPVSSRLIVDVRPTLCWSAYCRSTVGSIGLKYTWSIECWVCWWSTCC